jgi:hypothetical protein
MIACAVVLLWASPSSAERADLRVTLTGIQEVPGPGDADGTGTVEIRVDSGEDQLCWNLYARQIDTATAVHIYRGAAGIAGAPVITLTTPGADGHSQGCMPIDEAMFRELAMRGHEYYVSIHTQAHPDGAIRGQLRGGSTRRRRLIVEH